jgi:hypothetical protein
MSIMLPRYSGFPPEIFECGLVPQMSDSAFRLYMFLCRTSDRKSSLQFTATDKEIGEQAGPSPRSLQGARANLTRIGLIACERVPGGIYAYSLCDVASGKPFPGDPKTRVRYVKKESKDKVDTHLPPSPASLPTLAKIAPAPLHRAPLHLDSNSRAMRQEVIGDTSFAYGHNQALPEMTYFPSNFYDETQ